MAALLGTRVAADGGQPAQLALANHPTVEQLAAHAASAVAPEMAVAPVGELPAVALASGAAPAEPMAPEADFQAAFADTAPIAPPAAQMVTATPETVSRPVVQPASAERAARAAPARTGSTALAQAAGSHLVQLGSFSSEAGARRAWSIYEKKYPQLADYRMVITKAVVRGKTYFRVSAGGLSRAAAASTCSSVKRKGQGCYTWAEGRPMPGAVDTGVRFARR